LYINFFEIYSDQTSTAKTHLRFMCTVTINKREIGRGVGQNKKQAKNLAATQALKNIAPSLYQEWKAKLLSGAGGHSVQTAKEESKVSS
jgi:Double-stranded RNA binding motif